MLLELCCWCVVDLEVGKESRVDDLVLLEPVNQHVALVVREALALGGDDVVLLPERVLKAREGAGSEAVSRPTSKPTVGGTAARASRQVRGVCAAAAAAQRHATPH